MWLNGQLITIWGEVVISPPGTVVREVFYFARDVFFFSMRNLRGPSADRRETLPHDRKLVQFYNAGSKLRGRSPPKKKRKWGGEQKHTKFRSILYLLRLWSLISPEWLSQNIQNRKVNWSRTIPPALQEKGPVNFGPLIAEIYTWVYGSTKMHFLG